MPQRLVRVLSGVAAVALLLTAYLHLAPSSAASSAPPSLQHVVVLFQENHTFDNYFGTFPDANGVSLAQLPRCSDWMTSVRKDAQPCQWTEADIPYYWHLARTYGLSDNYFTAVNGPSFPNHFMLLAGQAPLVENPPGSWQCPQTCYDVPDNLFSRLSAADRTWQVYSGKAGQPGWDPTFAIQGLYAQRAEHPLRTDRQLFADIAAGQLPSVAFVKPAPELSEHPSSGDIRADLRDGEHWVQRVVQAIQASPDWSSTAIFITWDDWGAVYDHVRQPVRATLDDSAGRQTESLGPRVPLLVVGPLAKPGYLSHVRASHLSIDRFIERNFGLQPMTPLDAGASDLSDFFTFGGRNAPAVRPAIASGNVLTDPSAEALPRPAPQRVRPEGWVLLGAGAEDGQDCRLARTGRCSLRLTGTAGGSAKIKQSRYDLVGGTGDAYDFTAWSTAGDEPGSTPEFRLVAIVHTGNGSHVHQSAPFAPGAGGWTQAHLQFTTTEAYAGIDVVVEDAGPGSVWFDSFSLSRVAPTAR